MRLVVALFALAVATPAAALPGLSCRFDWGRGEIDHTEFTDIDPARRRAFANNGPFGRPQVEVASVGDRLVLRHYREDGTRAVTVVEKELRPEGHPSEWRDYTKNGKILRTVKGWCLPFESGA